MSPAVLIERHFPSVQPILRLPMRGADTDSEPSRRNCLATDGGRVCLLSTGPSANPFPTGAANV